MDRTILKDNAKNILRRNYGNCIVITILMMLCAQNGVLLSYISIIPNLILQGELYSASSLDALIGTPQASSISFSFWGFFIFISIYIFIGFLIFSSFKCGGIRYFLKLRKNQPVEIPEIFQHLKDKTFINIAKVTFIREIKIALWYLLFMIPGIIKAFEYWAIDYILAVRPDIDQKEAFRLSKVLMDGNKWDCFVLGLSFWGWAILAGFSGGLLGILYVYPYMQLTYTEFFADIRLQALAKGAITPNDIPDYEFIHPQTQYQQPFYQQPKNVVYRPDGSSVGNTVYTQQPQQPIYQPFGQPMQQPVETVEQPEIVEQPVKEAPTEETNE